MITKAWRILSINGHQVLLCLICNRYSYHPQDITHHYCGGCGFFLDELPADFVPENATAPRYSARPIRPFPPQEERIHSPLFQGEETP